LFEKRKSRHIERERKRGNRENVGSWRLHSGNISIYTKATMWLRPYIWWVESFKFVEFSSGVKFSLLSSVTMKPSWNQLQEWSFPGEFSGAGACKLYRENPKYALNTVSSTSASRHLWRSFSGREYRSFSIKIA